jgi:hypothetical protein
MQQKAKLTIAIDPRVIHVEHGWWFPEEPPDHGIWKSNANLLIDDQPPCDPAMGYFAGSPPPKPAERADQ